ncbi:protein turtle homolog A-like, partial [Heptranchias perlo]|uniref:protein turtle homolog A-like n=1 Tax=Heptranchias perlo TaxID=212740 RepID=UPI00355A2906
RGERERDCLVSVSRTVRGRLSICPLTSHLPTGRLSLQEGDSLLVDDVRSQDRGWYQCRVLFLTQPYDDRNGSWIYLTVTTPPTFRRTPPPLVEARLGDPVLLICEARGVPEPVVTWTKDGRQLTPFVGGEKYQVTDGRLRLEMADRSNVGVYVCEANSEEGNLMHSTQVLVRGPPAIVRPPGNVTVNYTQEVFFPCGAEAHPANLSYSWLKEGVNVRHLSELRLRIKILVDGSLLLSQSRPRDSGLYTCVASNGIGDPPRASAHLSVL